MGPVPFARDTPPVEIEVTGRRVPEWQMEDGSAGTLPQSPVVSREKDETLRLVPYGTRAAANHGVSPNRVIAASILPNS